MANKMANNWRTYGKKWQKKWQANGKWTANVQQMDSKWHFKKGDI